MAVASEDESSSGGSSSEVRAAALSSHCKAHLTDQSLASRMTLRMMTRTTVQSPSQMKMKSWRKDAEIRTR